MPFLPRRLHIPLPPLSPFSHLSTATGSLPASYRPISIHHPLLSSLSSCRSLRGVQRVHALLLVSGLSRHPFVASKLVHVLISLSSIDYAGAIFSSTPSPTLFTFNILIKAHSFCPPKSVNSSLLLLRSLLRDHPLLIPNQYTISFALNSCCRLEREIEDRFRTMGEAEQLRGQALKRGFEANLFVCNCVIGLYGSWGMMKEAEKFFRESSDKDLFSWNSLIGGYVAVGEIQTAMKVFDEMPERDVVSWSTVIAGFVQEGSFIEAMELFHEMQLSGVKPNEYTLTSMLTSCANLVALYQGRWIHSYIVRERINMSERLLSALIEMYSKCGEITRAVEIFNEGAPKRTVFPYNAMLNGFAIFGMAEEAVDLFEKMKSRGVSPNNVTFVSLLNACSHGSLSNEGKAYFDSMKEIYCVTPAMEHYGCMVDLFGRAGLLDEAEEFISLMPISPDLVIWSALLNACRIHRDIERAERVGRIIKELNPNQVGCQVLLANIYSKSMRWDNMRHIRTDLENFGARKTPGWSAIEIEGIFHQFLVGDKTHPQTREIYTFLEELKIKLKKAGYEPELGEVLVDVDEEDRETALSIHSEKLAIALGLMQTEHGRVIRIVKNLRVCVDCHQAFKIISKLYCREIVVRDRVRFHYFKDGSCSCKDYW